MKNTELQTQVEFEIVRETSTYNRAIKWYLRNYHPDGQLFASLGFRTKHEALEQVRSDIYRGEKGFQIGNRTQYTHYIERRENA